MRHLVPRSCHNHGKILVQSWQDLVNILWKYYSKFLARSCQDLIKIMPRSCSKQDLSKIMENLAKILPRFIQDKILTRSWEIMGDLTRSCQDSGHGWVSEDFTMIVQSLKGGGALSTTTKDRLWRCFGVQGDYNHSDNEWKFTEEYTVAHHSHPVFYNHRAPAWHKSGSLGIWKGSCELCLQPLLVWKYSFLFPLHFQNPRIIVITVETLENLL